MLFQLKLVLSPTLVPLLFNGVGYSERTQGAGFDREHSDPWSCHLHLLPLPSFESSSKLSSQNRASSSKYLWVTKQAKGWSNSKNNLVTQESFSIFSLAPAMLAFLHSICSQNSVSLISADSKFLLILCRVPLPLKFCPQRHIHLLGLLRTLRKFFPLRLSTLKISSQGLETAQWVNCLLCKH